MAKKVEVSVLSPNIVLKTDASDVILALGRRDDRVLAATKTDIYEWSPQGQLLRKLASPLGAIEVAAFSHAGGDVVLARLGGMKLSGNFSAVELCRITDTGIDDLGWSDDLPRVTALSFSPDDSRLAFHSSTAGSGGSECLALVGPPRLRHPPLPPHGDTLGDRQAAEASIPKGKVTRVGCSNEATYVFETQRALCFAAHDREQVTEWALKGVEMCCVLSGGDFVTVSKSGKIRRNDARGEKVWESKARGSKLLVVASPDERFVVSGWVFSAASGAAVGQLQGITGLSLHAVFIGDALYVSNDSEVLGYSLAGVASE